MNVPSARQIVLDSLQEQGVESPVILREASLLKDGYFAGRRFYLAGGIGPDQNLGRH